jgi:hypothetical protein
MPLPTQLQSTNASPEIEDATCFSFSTTQAATRSPITRVHQLLCASDEPPCSPPSAVVAAVATASASPVTPTYVRRGEGIEWGSPSYGVAPPVHSFDGGLALAHYSVKETASSSSPQSSLPGHTIGRAFKKYYANATPSAHCHCCARTSRSALFMVCTRLRDGLCRKVICNKCFLKNGWNWQEAAQDKNWTCTHCRDACPKGGSQCFIYSRVNQRRIKKSDRLSAASNRVITGSRHSAILVSSSYPSSAMAPQALPNIRLSPSQSEMYMRNEPAVPSFIQSTGQVGSWSYPSSQQQSQNCQDFPALGTRWPILPEVSDIQVNQPKHAPVHVASAHNSGERGIWRTEF